MNLLLVEDNDDLYALLTEMLKMQGHTVIPAFSAEAALAELRLGTAVDLVLTDIGLPSMSGVVFAAEARALRTDIGIVFMTGAIEAPRGDRGGPPLLRKPFSMQALEAALAGAMAGRA